MDFKRNNWFKHFKLRTANIMDYETFQHFGILVPLIELDGKLQFLFQVRSNKIRQPGEVCFPGGKVDTIDKSHSHAAIREFSEELGVPESSVEIIGELDYMVTPFKLMLYPFLGIIDKGTKFYINKDEVQEIFFVPVEELLTMSPKEHRIFLEVKPEDNFPFHLIPNGKDYNWRRSSVTEEFYEYNGHIIWGLTARILTHVLEELRKIN